MQNIYYENISTSSDSTTFKGDAWPSLSDISASPKIQNTRPRLSANHFENQSNSNSSKASSSEQPLPDSSYTQDIVKPIITLQFLQQFRQHTNTVIPDNFISATHYQQIWMPHLKFEVWSMLLNQKAQEKLAGVEKSTFFMGSIKKVKANILHLFVTREPEYKPKGYEMPDDEYKLLNSVRNDDVMVLTKNKLPEVKNIRAGLEGEKLIKFLQNLGKNGAAFAYVINAEAVKNKAKNFKSLMVSKTSYEGLSEGKVYCYHFDSLLSMKRQYMALEKVKSTNLSQYLTDPLTFSVKDKDNEIDFVKKYTDDFNSSQLSTLKKVANSPANQICLVQGPPGTGKTHTIRGIVSMVSKKCKRILICTPSNKAVDEILSRISGKGLLGVDIKDEEIVRVGSTEYQPVEGIRKHSIDQMVNIRIKQKQFERCQKRLWIIDQMVKYGGDQVQMIQKMSEKYFNIDTGRIKISEESQHFFTYLVDIMNDFPETDEKVDLSEIIKIHQQLHLRFGLSEKHAQNFFSAKNFQGTLLNMKRKISREISRLEVIDFRRKEQNDWKDIKKEILSSAKIICSTLTMVGTNLFEGLEIDYLIVDEACQSSELETLIAIQLSPKKVVLVGDQNQLPPTVISKNHQKTKYSRSLFERLLDCGVERSMLKVQFRMHPEISKFPSTQFYWKKLENHKSVMQRDDGLKEFRSLFKKRVNFLDLQDNYEQKDFKSTQNLGEAKQTVDLIKLLCKHSKNLEGKIGIITPYKSQVYLLKSLLESSELGGFAKFVNTVDAFQGQEMDIIIMNCVRSNKAGQIGFLSDTRRLNVAITRAKHYLFMIGSTKTLNTNKVWRNLIQSVKENGKIF